MIDLDILLPAFVAGLLILALHVPLGREVLRRGIIFLDLAVAQVAALGVLLAEGMGLGEEPWAVQLGAALAALLAVLLLNWVERRWRDTQEALIGSVFVLAASSAVLVLSHDVHAGERIEHLLAGQILWVEWPQIAWVAALYTALLLLWWRLPALRSGLGFYLVFALAVTASVQLVGVYLVFASLIMPALAVRDAGRRGLWIAYAIGATGYALGLLASAWWDLPSGAAIIWALALSAVSAASRAARKPAGG
ncbi:MAG: metal ABC transporter permease [Gammaproteobacteria bacterium]|nr:metal ABC transporter permease [Gammaproteobacteria bacterium]MCP5136623.1 metal ABC transporter permease [Gammaproteobacteria bacterium]